MSEANPNGRRALAFYLRAHHHRLMRYRRAWMPGGTFFFTVNLADRSSRLLVEHIELLRKVVARIRGRHPFDVPAWVVLPEHMHAIWTLPEGDADFATRWGLIKAGFSRTLPSHQRSSGSRSARAAPGVWQSRYWEHRIRDDDDLRAHVDYVHFNPVKHGHVTRAADWPYSTIHRYIRRGDIDPDWAAASKVVLQRGEAFGE